MARLPRLTVPGLPHHLIQRGNNRTPIFADRADFEFMQRLLTEQAREAGVAVHAYVLMDDHFHLLATPTREDSLARMMQGVGRRYVRYYNQRHGRSGTLWEGRYRSAVLQADHWLLPCMAYLDLNPVRAGRVEQPQEWPWSSYRHYVGATTDKMVSPHSLIWTLGNTPFAREQGYAQRVEPGVTGLQQQALVDSALHGWALGDEAFLAGLQKQTPRRLSRGKPGRPRRAEKSSGITPTEVAVESAAATAATTATTAPERSVPI